jgi:hypothetical protein
MLLFLKLGRKALFLVGEKKAKKVMTALKCKLKNID